MKYLCLFFLIFSMFSCMKQCENLMVLSKTKCTFDREHLARVCVVRLGEKTGIQKKTIRGRISATKLPEPLVVGSTLVKACTFHGRKTFEKL